MNNKIVINGILGGILFALFTYFVEIFEKHPNYLKISAFLWSAPLFFFFMVYLTKSKNKDVLRSFTKHAIIGMILSISVYIITLIIYNLPIYTVVLTNLVITIIAIYLYVHFEIFNY